MVIIKGIQFLFANYVYVYLFLFGKEVGKERMYMARSSSTWAASLEYATIYLGNRNNKLIKTK
jgi:hypothetical protein